MSRVRSLSARVQSLVAVLFCLALSPSLLPAQTPSIPAETLEGAQRLVDAALASSVAWDRLAELVDAFGPRLSGSESLEASLDWILEGMAEDGLDNVRAEPVMVPRWIRGQESIDLVSPWAKSMAAPGFGW